jgi:Fe-S cluster assembly protein SufD
MNAVLAQSQPAWLASLRAEGAAQFEAKGLPTQRLESWKYTGLNGLKDFGFEPAPVSSTPGLAEPTREESSNPLVSGTAHRLVFVNGRFSADRSSVGLLPEGVILGGLADLLAKEPDRIRPHLGQLADSARRPLAALNTAWIEDGFVLIVPSGIALATPIEVVFIMGDGARHTTHPRHVIALDHNAEAMVIELHKGGAAGGFANTVAEVALGANASLRHYVVHQETMKAFAVETISATLGRDARYRGFALTVGGGLVRRDIEIALAGEGASAHVDGAYLVDGDRHTDTTILIDHQKPHCASRQTQKGVIDNHGRAVFQGKILVRPDAQKTDGNQLSQTLLLSPEAEIDVKPELEIHADDVKCTHGATVGRLDPDALFFLRARGIPEIQARGLLIEGFIRGALDEIDREDVREAFMATAANWLTARAVSKSVQ